MDSQINKSVRASSTLRCEAHLAMIRTVRQGNRALVAQTIEQAMRNPFSN